jgi:hypothetical protein
MSADRCIEMDSSVVGDGNPYRELTVLSPLSTSLIENDNALI